MNSKFAFKQKLESKNSNTKNDEKKKDKKVLAKIGSTGALFKKF